VNHHHFREAEDSYVLYHFIDGATLLVLAFVATLVHLLRLDEVLEAIAEISRAH